MKIFDANDAMGKGILHMHVSDTDLPSPVTFEFDRDGKQQCSFAMSIAEAMKMIVYLLNESL